MSEAWQRRARSKIEEYGPERGAMEAAADRLGYSVSKLRRRLEKPANQWEDYDLEAFLRRLADKAGIPYGELTTGLDPPFFRESGARQAPEVEAIRARATHRRGRPTRRRPAKRQQKAQGR